MKSRSIEVAVWVIILSFGSLERIRAETTQQNKPVKMHRDAQDVDSSAVQTLDVTPFDALLSAYVRNGRVDFEALRTDPSALAQLAKFLESVAAMPENEPLASWINVYNALVIDFVLEHYPLGSVMDVPNFFSELKRTVAGVDRSLDDVENSVIRPRFKDARVHFALNCGAVSCPPLPGEAFKQAELNAQLDAVSSAGVNDAAHVAMRDGKLYLSELFFWFKEDFEREAGSLQAWLRRYAHSTPLSQLSDEIPLVQEPYDWALGSANSGGH